MTIENIDVLVLADFEKRFIRRMASSRCHGRRWCARELSKKISLLA